LSILSDKERGQNAVFEYLALFAGFGSLVLSASDRDSEYEMVHWLVQNAEFPFNEWHFFSHI